MDPICKKCLNRRKVLASLAVPALVVTGALAQKRDSAEGSVQAALRSSHKWLFAHTSRLPLDPLEAWNQWPATVEMEGARVRLNVFQAFKDVTLTLILKVQDDGFTFEWPGHADFFMRLDTADVNAPFKGRTGDMTIWLLRTK